MAASLKDIRVGQYDNYTRIVLEFDDPIEFQTIKPQAQGHLTIVFPDAWPNMVRKIPLERSQRLKDIQIWQRQNELSVVLAFDFDHFRYEYFQLNAPPRIALDIYQLAAAETPPIQASTGVKPRDGHQATAKSSEFDTRKSPAHDDQSPSQLKDLQAQAVEQSPAVLSADNTEKRATQKTSTDKDSEVPKHVPPVIKQQDLSQTPKTEHPKTGTFQLQFYLVLALVIITIVILVLLLLMLLFRHRWAGEKGKSSTGESLQRQDQRIASLNERIQEQLKRYDEV